MILGICYTILILTMGTDLGDGIKFTFFCMIFVEIIAASVLIYEYIERKPKRMRDKFEHETKLKKMQLEHDLAMAKSVYNTPEYKSYMR